MHEKINSFLKYVEKKGNENVKYKRVVEKPSKTRAIIGFIVSLLIFISSLLLLFGSLLGFIVIIVSFIVLIYYATNVFTKKGLGIYKWVPYMTESFDKPEEPGKEKEYVTFKEFEVDGEDEDDKDRN